MRRNARSLIYLAAAAACMLAAAAILYVSFVPHTIRFDREGRIRFSEEKSFWLNRIQASGGHAAYRQFGYAASELPPKRAHVAAHVFGEALYETEGFAGMSVCDENFAMGCIHAFFGSAALDLGVESFLNKAADACAQQATQGMTRLCLHGVGHGLLAVVGYDTADLERALELCETIPNEGNLTTGCWGGAFMEHNVRTLVSLDVPERAFSDSVAYEPCSELKNEYKGACVFWQSTWWDAALSRSLAEDDVYKKIGELCAAAPTADLSRSCTEGAGFRASWISGYEPEAAAKLCAQMSSSQARVSCWHSAATELPHSRAGIAAPLVCEGLATVQKDACLDAL